MRRKVLIPVMTAALLGAFAVPLQAGGPAETVRLAFRAAGTARAGLVARYGMRHDLRNG